MKLTVYYDGQYWIGFVESGDGEAVSIYRHVFGSEPGNAQVLAFVQKNLPRVLVAGVSAPLPAHRRHVNPKRLQRLIADERRQAGPGIKALEAYQTQLAERKKARRRVARDARQQAEQERYLQRRKRAQAKHRGH
ncbi:MAG: YjdF family protein [Sporolactobacillus sp.]